MDFSGVLNSASRLKKSSLYKVTIAENTREILLQLNSMIMSSHDAGLSRVEFRLPINFRSVDKSVSNQELQTAIYYNVITELEKKEYDVSIEFCKTSTLLNVSWAVKASTSDLERMQAKLMSQCTRN